MKTLSFDTYPHILDGVLAHAPHGSLLVLRATCKTLRDRADAILVSHIAAFCAHGRVAAVRHGRHWRIPRLGWLTIPALADAVRCVDICTDQEDESSPVHRGSADTEGRSSAAPTEPVACWCWSEEEAPLFNQFLAARLRRVQPIREWGWHRRRQAIAALRTVTFFTARPKWDQPHLLNNIDSPVSVVHVGYWSAPCFRFLPGSDGGDLIIRCTSVRALPPSIANAPPDAAERLLKDTAATETAGWQRRVDHPPHRMPLPARPFDDLVGEVSVRLARGTTVTLVGVDTWPLGLPASDVDFRTQLKNAVRTNMVQFSYLDPPEVQRLVDSRLAMVTEDEYRVSVGDDMDDLEAFTPQAIHGTG